MMGLGMYTGETTKAPVGHTVEFVHVLFLEHLVSSNYTSRF